VPLSPGKMPSDADSVLPELRVRLTPRFDTHRRQSSRELMVGIGVPFLPEEELLAGRGW